MTTKYVAILSMHLMLLTSCFLMPAPKVNMEFKKDDLNQNVIDSLDFFTNAAYRMNPDYTNDFIVALIRMNVLNVPTANKFAKIMLDLILVKNESSINELVIRSKLTESQIVVLEREFPKGLKSKKDNSIIRAENPELNEKLTCTPEIVDANWAYLSGTGDLDVVNKMIESSKVIETPCCFSCIEWSVPSQAIQNKDVYDRLVEIDRSLPENSRKWFSRYMPDLGDVLWENNYQEMKD